MKGELKMDVNEYLPLRDVVFNTLRPGYSYRRDGTWRKTYGDTAC